MVGMAKRTPWLCGEDSTAIAPIVLARKHESRVADFSSDLTPSNNGASSKKEKEKKKESVLSLLSARAPTSWLPSRRKAPACAGDGRTVSAEKSKEVSFNMGFGAGLIFLYAKSATEVHRMMALRAEMESLLKQIRGEISTSGGISSSASTSNLHADCREPVEVQSAADSVFKEDCQLACYEHSQEEISEQHINSADAESHMMEQLEAELESELERLQLNLDSDGSATPCWEVEVIGVSSGRSRTDSKSSETDDSRDDNVNDLSLTCENGVCPRELERRLYKLLDSRHREQIAKLESALEEANRKLHEKEKEIQKWRDTDRLVLDAGRDGPCVE